MFNSKKEITFKEGDQVKYFNEQGIFKGWRTVTYADNDTVIVSIDGKMPIQFYQYTGSVKNYKAYSLEHISHI